MTYTKLCETTDIDAFYQSVVFDTNTTPTKVIVEEWIDQATALIYSVVASQYVVPVTDTDDLLILKNLCVQYVRDEVNFVLSKNRVAYSDNRVIVPRGINHKQFYRTLEEIKDGTFRLLNTASSAEVNSYSYNAANSITPKAKKESTQW